MAEIYFILGIYFIDFKNKPRNILRFMVSGNIKLRLAFDKRFFGGAQHLVFTALCVGLYIAYVIILGNFVNRRNLNRNAVGACMVIAAAFAGKTNRTRAVPNSLLKRNRIFYSLKALGQLFKAFFIGFKRNNAFIFTVRVF